MQTVLVTGGAGFIGSCFVRRAAERGGVRIINLDKLTYAGNPDSLPPNSERHELVVGDIGEVALVRQLLEKWSLDGTLIGTTSNISFTPHANLQGSHTLKLTLGEDNGSGRINTQLPTKVFPTDPIFPITFRQKPPPSHSFLR